MQCPRCGAENADTSVACWKCFAQLSVGTSKRPQKVDTGKSEPAEQPETAAEEAQAAPTAEESKEEVAAEPGYVVPGLAESPPQAEQAPEDQPPEEPAADAETAPPEEAPESPEPEVKPPPRRPMAVPGEVQPSKNIMMLFVIVIVILPLLVVSYFVLANPSPAPVAEEFINAVDSVMAGDTTKLSEVASAASQRDVGRTGEIFEPFRRLRLRVAPVEVTGKKVTGASAEITVRVKVKVANLVEAEGPVHVELVKEGSILRREWKVDLAKTGERWTEELPGLLRSSTPVPGARSPLPGLPAPRTGRVAPAVPAR